MAEENVIAQILREPALLDQIRNLKQEEVSSSLLGNVYGQLRARHEQGLEVSLAVLAELGGEEMSHIAGIVNRHQNPVDEQGLKDCVRTIQSEYGRGAVATEDDLLALQKKLQERKGFHG